MRGTSRHDGAHLPATVITREKIGPLQSVLATGNRESKEKAYPEQRHTVTESAIDRMEEKRGQQRDGEDEDRREG